MILMWLTGGGLVLAGNTTTAGAVWLGYKLATSHERQLQYEAAKYGRAGVPGMPPPGVS